MDKGQKRRGYNYVAAKELEISQSRDDILNPPCSLLSFASQLLHYSLLNSL